jgi:hypothetical protein
VYDPRLGRPEDLGCREPIFLIPGNGARPRRGCTPYLEEKGPEAVRWSHLKRAQLQLHFSTGEILRALHLYGLETGTL